MKNLLIAKRTLTKQRQEQRMQVSYDIGISKSHCYFSVSEITYFVLIGNLVLSLLLAVAEKSFQP